MKDNLKSASFTLPDGRQIVERAPSKAAATRALHDRIRVMLGEKEQRENITLAEYAPTWFETFVLPRVRGENVMKRKGTIAKKQADWYLDKINRYLIPLFGAIALRDLTTMQLQNGINEVVSAKNLAEKTCGDIVIVLHAVLGQAYMDGIIPRNPADDLLAHGKEPHPRRALTPHENDLIMRYDGANRDAPMFQVMRMTGARDNELCALRVGDVNMREGIITFRWGLESGRQRKIDTPKTDAGQRDVPILVSIRPVLERLIAGKTPDEFVFTNASGNQLTVTEFIRRWGCFWRDIDIREGAEMTKHGHIYDPEADFDKSGVPLYPDEVGRPRNGHKVDPHVTPYYLRHSFATDLKDAHVPANLRMAIMGHTDEKTTEGYTHYDSSDSLYVKELLERHASGSKTAAGEDDLE